MKPYQLDAVERITGPMRGRALLAFEQGLGKVRNSEPNLHLTQSDACGPRSRPAARRERARRLPGERARRVVRRTLCGEH